MGEEFGEPDGDGAGEAGAADDGLAGEVVKPGPGEAVGAGEGVDFADGFFIFKRINKGAGDILDINGLKQARTAPAEQAGTEIGHEKEGRGGFACPAGDLSHEFTLWAVDEGGAEDGPFQGAVAEDLLGGEFGPVVLAGGIGTGSEGGHMDKTMDFRGLGGVDEGCGGLFVETMVGDAVRRLLADDADEMNDGIAAGEGL